MKTLAEYTSLTGVYSKSQHEDVLSIMQGISQQKGDVHITFCQPLTEQEIAACARLEKNERFASPASVIDQRIHTGYKLHKTNYIAADLLSCSSDYESYYTTEQMEEFIDYVNRVAFKGPSLAAEERIKEIFLKMYSNPVKNSLEESK
jgi:hypothetical protein